MMNFITLMIGSFLHLILKAKGKILLVRAKTFLLPVNSKKKKLRMMNLSAFSLRKIKTRMRIMIKIKMTI